MFYEFWVGLRYAGFAGFKRNFNQDRFVSFIAASSMAGIALGVAALIVVISVMNGFQRDVRDRMLSVLPHIELYANSQPTSAIVDSWQEISNLSSENENVVGGAPFVAAQAMLARGKTLSGAQIRGIDSEYESLVSDLEKQMVMGNLNELQASSFNIVLGRDLANILRAYVGDTIMVMAPQGSVTPAGFTPRMRQFVVSGIFSSGHYEYDSSLAFMHVKDAAIMFRDSGSSGVRLKIKDMHQAPMVSMQLGQSMPSNIYAQDWTQNNKTWFAAVQTEKRMMFLILTLIVAVAAFNLLSSLVMTVKDKQSDIAILRTLGSTPGQIAIIFLIQGAFIGIIGTVAGVFLGSLIAYNIDVIVPFIEGLFGIEFLPQQIYFITQLPSDPRINDITIIGITSLVLSLLATLYPSYRASKLQPATVLRHE